MVRGSEYSAFQNWQVRGLSFNQVSNKLQHPVSTILSLEMTCHNRVVSSLQQTLALALPLWQSSEGGSFFPSCTLFFIIFFHTLALT